MKRLPLFVKSILVLLPVIVFLVSYNLRMEEQRLKPHIYTMRAGKELVAKIKGDPEITMDTAEITLYSAGRKLKLSPSYISGRHLDWKQRYTTPMKDWVVHYSIMVPETAIGLADIKDSTTVSIFYDRRKETQVGEILHLGRYEGIPKSLVQLRQFVERQGYRLSGYYEEVYLVFEHIEPDPDNYETLLRYQVSKL